MNESFKKKCRIHWQHGSERIFHQLRDILHRYSHAHTFIIVIPDKGKNITLFMLIADKFFVIKHLDISYQLGKAEFMLYSFPAQNDNEVFI